MHVMEVRMAFLLVEEAAQLIQMEYAEMPGLKLTFSQARCLWNLSDELCERALGTLMRSGYLVRTADGGYIRRGTPPCSVEQITSLVRAM
jgi:hypothetical protein